MVKGSEKYRCYIASEKIILTMDQRLEVVKEIIAKAGLLKEVN